MSLTTYRKEVEWWQDKKKYDIITCENFFPSLNILIHLFFAVVYLQLYPQNKRGNK